MNFEKLISLLAALGIIAMIALGPWCFIWGLNTVSDLGIDWTWNTGLVFMHYS